ncbi:MAG: hypothetical protein II838_02060 [Lachnospiraceae bacterium]|nr:hypothetical protein [Lachnospiraceae bacterium]
MKRVLQVMLGLMLIVSGMVLPQPITVEAGSGLMVVSYEIEKGDFSPGSESTIKLTIKNQNVKAAATEITAEISSGSSEVTSVYGESNQKFLGNIGPGQTLDVSFRMDVGAQIDISKAQVTLKLSYTMSGEDTEKSSSVFIPVKQNGGIVINGVSVADSAKIGSKALISITYENSSDETLKNVTFNLDGNIEEDGKTVEIGNLESGASDYHDAYVKFTELGEQTVSISVEYTDMEGNKFTKDVSNEVITVSEGEVVNNNTTVIMPDQENGILKTVLKYLVLVAIFVLLVVTYKVIVKKKD